MVGILIRIFNVQIDFIFLFFRVRFFFDYWPNNGNCLSYIDIFEGRGPTSDHTRICDDTAEYEADIYQTASELIWVHYHSYAGEEVDFQIDYYTRMKDNRTIECGGELNGRVFLMDQFWAL